MEPGKINEIIELLDTITMDINSVEVRLIDSGEGKMQNRCASLWLEAYMIKEDFKKMQAQLPKQLES